MAKKNKTHGFSLAETLVTLAIIAVVAGMTIPQLITGYQKQETATRLEKIYSTLNNAIAAANAEAPIDSWNFCVAGMSAIADDCAIIANIIPKLNVSEKFRCFISPYSGSVLSECFITKYPSYKTTAGDYLHYTYGSYVVLLQDGSLIQFSGSAEPLWKMTIGVDINGIKGPNKVGIDIFSLKLIKDATTGIYKLKNYHDLSNCAKPAAWSDMLHSRASQACFMKIIQDGFEIKSNYPWEDLNTSQ